MKALCLRTFGKPTTAPELIESGPPEPKAGEVVVSMEAAPINPSDLLLISGRYGHRPALPAALGSEGVGRIAAVGEGVEPARIGQRVMIIPTLKHGTWQDQIAVNPDDLVPVDPGADPLQLAMLGVNPVTADLLLRLFVDLPPGAWVGQTAGNSAVGRYIIELSRMRGFRTLSVVRRPEAASELLAQGADVVLVDGPDLTQQAATVLGEERVSLLLDSVAGETVTKLAAWLVRGGTIVNYGGMSGQPVAFAPADLIFHDIHVRGFWQKHWLDTAPRDEVGAVYSRLASLIAEDKLQTPVAATYSLERHRDALRHAADASRSGKVLFAW